MLMKISDLQVTYGVIKAIDEVNVEVQPGEILSIVGANGAGKTTASENHRRSFETG